jgi:predicted nucleic acid-binding protein
MRRGAIVVNTGPLIALEGIGRLGLLVRLFDRVLVPTTVSEEMAAQSDTPAPELPAEIQTVEPTAALDPLLIEMLDPGEAGVIQTALAERIPTQVLIDEKKGRKVARLYGLQVFGTARLLVEAKQAGLIDSVGQAMQAMRSNGYWIDEKIVRWAKTIAGEDLVDG